MVRLCINPYCSARGWANLETAVNCDNCGCQLLVHGIYTVKSLLSDKSGFGKVFIVEKAAAPSQVLKVLKPKFNDEPRTVALFQQEAALLQKIDTVSVPKIDAYIHHELPDGQILHGIVMEKIPGDNLLEWLQKRGNRPIDQAQAIAWLREIVQVLQLVHQVNYFHRDIKPSNIMLKPSGELVLIDFGAARQESYTYMDKLYGDGGITRIASAGYTPPEQQRGFAIPQSDFYALGMTFIHLVTGKYPLDMYDLQGDTYHWREFAPQVTAIFANLLDSLIAATPIDRPQDCASILHWLNEIEQPSSVMTSTLTKPSAPWQNKLWVGWGVVVTSLVGYLVASSYRLVPAPFWPRVPAGSTATDCRERDVIVANCEFNKSTGTHATTPN